MSYTIRRVGSLLLLNIDGIKITAYSTGNGVWIMDDFFNCTIYRDKDRLKLVSGSTVLFGYPDNSGGWIVSGSGGVIPPDPGGGDFSWPFDPRPIAEGGTVTYEFRPPGRPFHNGMDMAGGAASGGNPIPAVGAGTIILARREGGYGNSTIIDHGVLADGGRWYTRYGHALDGSYAVTEGQTVTKGQKLSEVGNTGNSFGNHLHFETLKGGTAYGNGVNPRAFMAAFGDGNVIHP